MNKSESFEISQSALITDNEKLLILQLPSGEWVFPGGKINVGEKWDKALQREVNEELGKRNIQILSILEVDNWSYQEKSKYGVFFHCVAEKVNDIILSNEHVDYRWIGIDEADDVKFFHDKMIDISKKVLKPLLEAKEYDVCIVGKGIIGKFLIHELNDKGFNVCVIDGFEEDSIEHDDFYNVYEYVDKEGVWDKNATGNITFPTNEEIQELGFSIEEYYDIKEYLLSQLSRIDFEKYEDSEIDSLMHFVINNIGIDNIKYFVSARNKIEKKQILDRGNFDKYWHNNKTFYNIDCSKVEIIKGNAIKFISLHNGVINDLLVKTNNGVKIIMANKFILANHTVGVLSLLNRTNGVLGNDFIDKDKIGLGFVEHPQLSIGAIIKDQNFAFERKLPTTYLYSDFTVNGLNFRIEYHTAPPIQEKARRYYRSGFSQKDFEERFIRFSCIIQQNPSDQKTLDFNDAGKIFTTNVFKEEVMRIAKLVSEKIYEMLDCDGIEILNAESSIYFSGHLIGGIQGLTDETNYKINGVNNLYIASSSTFKTGGLFNPTFTILCLAKKIINENFSS